MGNINFNRQFILIDFRLLEAEGFLDFIGSSEFATYLVLRRNIWRSSERHYLELHDVYLQERLLACSLERKKVSEVTGVDPDNISRHLSKLEERKVIRRRRTGRQNIYVLGEWVDVNGNGSYKLEWFYLDGRFGVSKTDLTDTVRSDLSETSGQIRPPASDNNKEINREENTVNGREQLRRMPRLDQPEARTKYVADTILSQLGDAHSARFYRLVAAKIPEAAIRRMFSEIKVDGAENPAKVFTYKVKEYAKRHYESGNAL